MERDQIRLPVSFEQAADLLGDQIKKYAQKFSLGNEIDSEDLVQEGLIALEKALRTYDGSGRASFKTYGLRCAKNAMMDCIDKAQAKKRIPSDMKVSLDNTEGLDIPSESDLSDHMVVEETMRSLSELESAALSYFIAGYSPVEISEKLGKSLKTVQNALARAKGKFRNNLPR